MTVFTSHDDVQIAIYNKLVPGGVLDSTLAALGVTAVHDIRAVPQNRSFDYITVGLGNEMPHDTLGEGEYNNKGFDYVAQVDIWSRQAATQPAAQMLNRLNELLHNKVLSLPTLQNVYCMYQRSSWLADQDGLTLHIAVFYKTYSSQQ